MDAAILASWRGPAPDSNSADIPHLRAHRPPLIPDPWSARDQYGTVVGSESVELERYVRSVATGARNDDDLIRARELLEMERDALRMFTSCGWFFDDIGGIEPRQNLCYAARAIALAGPEGAGLETALLRELQDAVSNDASLGTAREIYERTARPRIPAPCGTRRGRRRPTH